jgi:hypothetical protein
MVHVTRLRARYGEPPIGDLLVSGGEDDSWYGGYTNALPVGKEQIDEISTRTDRRCARLPTLP